MVAVTGYSWSTALGNSIEEGWQRLCKGESGLVKKSSEYTLRNDLVGDFVGKYAALSPSEKMIRVTCDKLLEVCEDANVDIKDEHITLIIGTSLGAYIEEGNELESLDFWALQVKEKLGLARDIIMVSTACSSGADAILMAAELIKGGVSDICICGATDIISDVKRKAHTAMGTLSKSTLKSFDTEREGTLLGEGSGFMVLERYERAKERGAKIKATCVAAGSSNDSAGMTAPDSSGHSVQLAVKRALMGVDFGLSDIDIINAHGSGTLLNDELETKAYNGLFGDREDKPVIFATKGALGHSLGATGILEAITVVLSLEKGFVPPIYNHTNTEPTLKLPIPPKEGLPLPNSQLGMSVTIGFGGFNTCIVFRKQT